MFIKTSLFIDNQALNKLQRRIISIMYSYYGEKANTETDQAQPATSTDAESEKVSAEETDSTGAEDSGEPATSSEGATSSEAPAESSGEGAID